MQAEASRNRAELDLANLAPKKANWDLKRDVERQMAYLDKRTSLVIVALVRARLQGTGDLSAMVGAAEQERALAEEEGED